MILGACQRHEADRKELGGLDPLLRALEDAEVPPEVKEQRELILATVKGLLDSPDADLVTVHTDDAHVEIVKEGDTLRIAVDADREVSISGFGKFYTSRSAARQGRNPATGETIQIAAKKHAKFKPAKGLKDRVAV